MLHRTKIEPIINVLCLYYCFSNSLDNVLSNKVIYDVCIILLQSNVIDFLPLSYVFYRAAVLDGVTDFLLFLCKLFVVGGLGEYRHANNLHSTCCYTP